MPQKTQQFGAGVSAPRKVPKLRRDDNKHTQTAHLHDFVDQLQSYGRAQKNAKLATALPNVQEALEVAIATIKAFQEGENEIITNIDTHCKHLSTTINNLQNDMTIITSGANQTNLSSNASSSSAGASTRARKLFPNKPLRPPTVHTISDTSSQPYPPTQAELEITIKMNQSDKAKALKKEGPQETVKAINTAIQTASNSITALKGIKVKAARSFRSFDILALARNRKEYELLKEHGGVWPRALDEQARLAVETFKVVIHKVKVETVGKRFDPSSAQKVHDLLKRHNPAAIALGGIVCSVAWLKTPRTTLGSLVVSFDKAKTANYLIKYATFLDHTGHVTERHDQSYRMFVDTAPKNTRHRIAPTTRQKASCQNALCAKATILHGQANAEALIGSANSNALMPRVKQAKCNPFTSRRPGIGGEDPDNTEKREGEGTAGSSVPGFTFGKHSLTRLSLTPAINEHRHNKGGAVSAPR
ncbi:hypothetical protein AYL99_11662 [Fonsecaea erecta]|uniref:Uncharacterized protein n=1 Tax=Fonsecaea erecta TaxID=1367422 RepID=A0A178Z329_9EURO|nr:hypothetical protein AYL99_11662 [Fonsecaea erecta]OAP54127.1 hypothetical protein AYL99_11662 [Fonsecaea erecta]